MVGFKKTEWEFSNETNERIPVEEGDRYLYISGAEMGDDQVYIIKLEDVTSGAKFSQRYWLNKQDGSPDQRSRGTLISLGTALAGEPIGIPYPDDVVGGVVIGENIKINDKGYARVYSYRAADAGILQYVKDELKYKTIEQHTQ